jgi:hypothetical protein
MGLFSRFFVQALPCTAEGTLWRVRDTRSLVSASRLRDESIQLQHIMLWSGPEWYCRERTEKQGLWDARQWRFLQLANCHCVLPFAFIKSIEVALHA